jgi:hypothetical protein
VYGSWTSVLFLSSSRCSAKSIFLFLPFVFNLKFSYYSFYFSWIARISVCCLSKSALSSFSVGFGGVNDPKCLDLSLDFDFLPSFLDFDFGRYLLLSGISKVSSFLRFLGVASSNGFGSETKLSVSL